MNPRKIGAIILVVLALAVLVRADRGRQQAHR